MGQSVNPILYKSGISDFWGGHSNFPNNNFLSNINDYNVFFNLCNNFFKLLGVNIYYLKSFIIKNDFYIYIYFFSFNYLNDKLFRKYTSFDQFYKVKF